MRAAFFTLGCKVNQYETQALMGLFAREGYDIVSPEDTADVYILNSCTVTASSDKKTRQTLRRFKRRNPGALAVLAGCFPQAFPDAARALPEADVIAGSGNRSALPGMVREALATGKRVVSISPHSREEPFEAMQVDSFAEHTRAFVKIQDGCERYCSYCIIPYARGFVRSKAPADLLVELQELARAGYREAVLVGVNLSAYGKDFGLRLADAVELACSVEGLGRIRLGSIEPDLITDEDMARMAAQEKFCPQFHFALQSGCDATLRRMNRHYDTAFFRDLALRTREAFPGASLTTDIMVGFPGETREEFEESLAFMEEIAFAKAHVFAYSSRPGTWAASFPGQVDAAVKEARSREMIALTDKTRQAFLSSQAGTVQEVLFETREGENLYTGYTKNYTPVTLSSREDLRGTVRSVALEGTLGDGCGGRLL